MKHLEPAKSNVVDHYYTVSFGKCRHVGAFQFEGTCSVPIYRKIPVKGFFTYAVFLFPLPLIVTK